MVCKDVNAQLVGPEEKDEDTYIIVWSLITKSFRHLKHDTTPKFVANLTPKLQQVQVQHSECAEIRAHSTTAFLCSRL